MFFKKRKKPEKNLNAKNEDIKKTEIKIEVEKLEERIAPTPIFKRRLH